MYFHHGEAWIFQKQSNEKNDLITIIPPPHHFLAEMMELGMKSFSFAPFNILIDGLQTLKVFELAPVLQVRDGFNTVEENEL